MNTPLNLHKDFLDEALKDDAARYRDAYIDDAGFTLRVMDALPLQSQNVLSSKKRFAIIFGMATFAALIATTLLSGGNLLIDASMDMATDTITPSVVGLFTITLVATVTAISAVMGKR